MKITTTLALAFAALTLPGCHAESPTREPETVVVGLTYVPSRQPADCSAPAVVQCYGFCYHNSAPANLQVVGSWEEWSRLESCNGGYCAILTRVPVGREVGVQVFDIGQCCRDCSSSVRENVYANGTRLVRFGASGLAFSVNGRGVVTP